MIENAEMPEDMEKEIVENYDILIWMRVAGTGIGRCSCYSKKVKRACFCCC